MIFLVPPSGHEHYQKELAEQVASTAGPLDAAIAELRARHDIDLSVRVNRLYRSGQDRLAACYRA